MNKRILGGDLAVSPVGFGCMGFSHGYGAATEEKEAEDLIRRAFLMTSGIRSSTRRRSTGHRTTRTTTKSWSVGRFMTSGTGW